MNKFNPTIVLVHGAWADASSWNKVIPLLRAEGFTAVAVQIPLTSVEDDSAATSRIITDVEGPIVLVGHSWGGMAITQAGDDAKVGRSATVLHGCGVRRCADAVSPTQSVI
jgi:pimeloyl-ACP methyl ester carboxylesterase